MINDSATAAEVAVALREAFRTLDPSAALVRARCTEEERKACFQAVGHVLYELTCDLIAPLYERHPELKPDDWPTESGAQASHPIS